jgi:feruloyl-CoA synthase
MAPQEVDVERRPDGAVLVRSTQRLAPYPRRLTERLLHWAATAPDRIFLAERSEAGDWRKVTYAEAASAATSIGQALLDRGLSEERPVVILSENSVDHALINFAAMHVGVPVCPISTAYSLMSQDHAKLKTLVEFVRPGLIYVSSAARYGAALAAVAQAGADVVASRTDGRANVTSFDALRATVATAAVAAAFEALTPDTIAKILFTSGSTGLPKGVINTQRMLCSNQVANNQNWPFLEQRPPVLVDWLPWSHTFGGNINLNMVLFNGGSFYIDDGKPMPGLIERTVRNLREVAPTKYLNVPKGFDMLLPYLEKDGELRANFFSDLDMICYAGAALPESLWQRLQDVSVAARGKRTLLTAGWGATETSPAIANVHFENERPTVIGLPVPGTEIKMVPVGDKYELRIRGINVTPGYWRRPDLTASAFDDEGYYKIGDAGRFAVPDDPKQGIEFAGRIAEDFKLLSGTWVHVGALRIRVIAAGSPLIQDAVITGHDREEIGVLIFPSLAGCRALCPDAPSEASLDALVLRPEIVAFVKSMLARLANESGGSSTRVGRALVMAEPPSIDGGEITDKGYINQRAVLERRRALVEHLYAGGEGVVVLAKVAA